MVESADPDGQSRVLGYYPGCRCGAIRDDAKSKRGRSSRNRGNRRELELARALGAEKVGHFGGPQDVQSDLLVIQSKVRKAFPYWMTTELAKLPLTGGRLPVLIVTDSPGPGIPRSTLVVMPLSAFEDLHGRIKP
jgi:hypothetical protein